MRLIVDCIAVERGERLVLDEVSLKVEPGEALVVTGPNGAGKSTLLRALAHLLPLDKGRIELGGMSEESLPAEHIHLLGHADGAKSALTSLENLAAWIGILGGGGIDAERALKTVGIGHAADLPAAMLSAGQRRRLAMARLLACQRPIWLLDEPATALDTDGLARLATLVAAHRSEGGLVVAATHSDLGWPDLRHMVLGHAA
ncbi:heme ABC exporter ATP-binding protein CcmA [Terrihabitans sp. B22-R8]|uniref:heme ABC exporter ATP-binding protein CcmA n=1 Tax=Terrihabitans sp. B22-R8 TaxID=3425128 RepID=UPI00403C80AD